MSLITYHTQCRLCGKELLTPIINLGNHYLHGLFNLPGFTPPSGTVPTKLMRCENSLGGCGLVQLECSVDPDILYARYGYRSSTNSTMRDHLSGIAKQALSLINPLPKRIPVCLDVGCNDGFLSKQFPSNAIKVGIDPCDIGQTIQGIDNFEFIHDLFPSPMLESYRAFDIVTMIACFYDVNDPLKVAMALKNCLHFCGVLVVELSYWPTKMAKTAIDEVCHEHVCFYNYQNLEYIFSQVGLHIFDAKLNDINGGSIQLWMCHQGNKKQYQTSRGQSNIQAIKFAEFNMELDREETFDKFVDNCVSMRLKVRDLITSIIKQNKTIHLYGASTKGNVLLQYCGLDSSLIPYASERSSEKWGGSTLGTNIKMIGEEESRAMKPDYYFVPIWGFKNEIIQRERDFLIAGGQLIFPLPELSVVGTS